MKYRLARVAAALLAMVSVAGCGGGGGDSGTGGLPIVPAPGASPTGTAGSLPTSPPSPTMPVTTTVEYDRDFSFRTPLAIGARLFVSRDMPPLGLDIVSADASQPLDIAFTAGSAERVELRLAGQSSAHGIADRLAVTPVRFYVRGSDSLRLGWYDANFRYVPRYAQMGLWNYGCSAMMRQDVAGEECQLRYFVFGTPSPILTYSLAGIDYTGLMTVMGGALGSAGERVEGSAIIMLHPHPAVNTIDGTLGFNERRADGSLGPRTHLTFKLPFDPLANQFSGPVGDRATGLEGTLHITLFGPQRDEVGFAFRVATPGGERAYAGIGVLPRQ